jgi:transcriptional regulator with XRE-family HTH domain
MGASDSSSVRPTTFGERFAAIREQAGLTLEDVASETKISLRILRALEDGRFEYLPEQIFCRNFIRQVATLAGTDPEPLLEDFDRAWELHRVESGAYPRVEPEPEPAGRRIRWGFWLPIGAGVVIALVVAWILVRGTSPGDPLPPDPRRSTAAIVEPARSPTRIPATPAERDPTPPPAVDDARVEPLEVVVTVVEDSECWIHYRDAAGRQDRRLLAGGDRLRLELVWPVKLTVGNAAAIELQVGGERHEELGRPGQVVHLELTPDGLSRLGPWEPSGE